MRDEISRFRVAVDPQGLLLTLSKQNRWCAMKALDQALAWELCATGGQSATIAAALAQELPDAPLEIWSESWPPLQQCELEWVKSDTQKPPRHFEITLLYDADRAPQERFAVVVVEMLAGGRHAPLNTRFDLLEHDWHQHAVPALQAAIDVTWVVSDTDQAA